MVFQLNKIMAATVVCSMVSMIASTTPNQQQIEVKSESSRLRGRGEKRERGDEDQESPAKRRKVNPSQTGKTTPAEADKLQKHAQSLLAKRQILLDPDVTEAAQQLIKNTGKFPLKRQEWLDQGYKQKEAVYTHQEQINYQNMLSQWLQQGQITQQEYDAKVKRNPITRYAEDRQNNYENFGGKPGHNDPIMKELCEFTGVPAVKSKRVYTDAEQHMLMVGLPLVQNFLGDGVGFSLADINLDADSADE